MPSQFSQIMFFKSPVKTQKGLFELSLMKKIEIIGKRINREATFLVKILEEENQSNFKNVCSIREERHKLINFDDKEGVLKEIDAIFKKYYS